MHLPLCSPTISCPVIILQTGAQRQGVTPPRTHSEQGAGGFSNSSRLKGLQGPRGRHRSCGEGQRYLPKDPGTPTQVETVFKQYRNRCICIAGPRGPGVW